MKSESDFPCPPSPEEAGLGFGSRGALGALGTFLGRGAAADGASPPASEVTCDFFLE